MKKNNQSNYLSAASIMQRLPFFRQMTAAQSLLIKCLPIWNKWAALNLSNETSNAVQLSHFQDGVLIMHCENAISATQIKQQQQTLLLFFQGEGVTEVKQLTVRINNNSTLTKNASTTIKNDEKQTQSNSDHLIRNGNTLDDNSLNSLKTVQKTTKNPDLSNSLTKLIRTIEQNNKNN